MAVIGSNSVAAQIYSGVQSRAKSEVAGRGGSNASAGLASQGGFSLPNNATPRGDWVLSENANPQNFESAAPRGTYLNVVV